MYYKQNRIKQLRALVALGRYGSISKAAENLHLSQPAVTLQLKALERDFDSNLLSRVGRNVELTVEGNMLLELALPLITGLDNLPHSFKAITQDMDRGELKIAAGNSMAIYIMPSVVRKFRQSFPQVDLHLHSVDGRRAIEMLEQGNVDFALTTIEKVPEAFEFEPVLHFEPVLITPLNHPLAERERVTMNDIADYELILPPRNLHTWREVDEKFSELDLTYKVALDVEDGGWETVKRYVESGLGIAIVTAICLTGDERIATHSLSHYFSTRSYGVLRRKGEVQSELAGEFIKIMRKIY